MRRDAIDEMDNSQELAYAQSNALQGQLALVTGAARGIGAGIAKALAAAGADVAINDINPADETAAACQAMGRRAKSFLCDVSDRNAVESMVDQVESEMGPISILVSNAAYSDRELFYQASMEGFQKTIDVCMWGPFYLTRAVANRMIPRSQAAGPEKFRGNIVVVSSPHAYKPIPGAMAYNMGKAAIDQMAKTAAVELAEYRIRVNIIHPGWTDTPGERKFFHEDELMERGKSLPWGRLAQPEDLGHGVAFLVDPRSDYITGATLSIDGGIVLPFQEMFRVKDRPAVNT
ncbi:SDR family NAD(P)-dependent oxidoreductase [Pirellulaceae bacterium SH467]